jgi:hypothetical protein
MRALGRDCQVTECEGRQCRIIVGGLKIFLLENIADATLVPALLYFTQSGQDNENERGTSNEARARDLRTASSSVGTEQRDILCRVIFGDIETYFLGNCIRIKLRD